ncbi:hypothetical protein [Tenacibaculum geojense]|uniref:Uncharacterized protein n=1 Tax=Tenacibaculum geojense TaxID=915352 RepID=A0ABW3JRC1_9FLAO
MPLADEDFHDTLMNPLDAQAKLFDYIVCKQIAFTPIKPEEDSYQSSGGHYGISTTTTIRSAHRFHAKMVFSRFFSNPNQVEPYAYFYEEGIKNGNPVKMNVKKAEKIYDSQGGEALQVEFSVPRTHRDKIRLHSEVLFAVRLHIDDTYSMHFPYPLGGEERFLGAKMRVKTLSAGLYQSSLDQNKEVVFDTLAELKTEKPW